MIADTLIFDLNLILIKRPENKQIAPFKLLEKRKWFFVCLIFFIFLSFLVFNPAKASIFGSVIKWLGGNNSNIGQPQSNNSQNIPLPSAPKNYDLPSALGGGNPTIIVNQNSLLAVVGPEGSLADIKDKVPPDRISIYVVREGDNLAGIAKMFGVSVNTILWANNIGQHDIIKVGQTLIILPISGVQYTVKEGDTIESIAKKWRGDPNDILQFNDLPPNHKLAVGSAIIIPDGEAPIPASTNVPRGIYRGGSGPYLSGYYIRPISGGRRSQGLHGWNGVDLAASCGTPIVAAASGDVLTAFSGWNFGYGTFVTIAHENSTQTLYAHMSSAIVGPGWHVVQGQVIGYIGSTGNSTGCHVHFEIRGAANPF